MNDCLFLFVGDKIYYENRLCEITELRSDGVVIKDGVVSRYVFCKNLAQKQFEWCIEFKKEKFSGYESTPSKEKALKEKAFLEEMGWEVKIYQVEAR